MNKPVAVSLLSVLFFITASVSAQSISKEELSLFTLLRKEFVADNAYKTVAFVEQRWRIAGNSGFNESIFFVEKILKDAGFVKETTGENQALLTYRIEKRPMQRSTWEPVNAQLSIEGEPVPVLEFKTNRNMLASYSGSTGSQGVTALLVDIGKGTEKDLEGKDLKGKIVLGDGGIGSVFTKAMAKGAIGVLSYSLPAYTQPTKHPNSIQFSSIRSGSDSQVGDHSLICGTGKTESCACKRRGESESYYRGKNLSFGRTHDRCQPARICEPG